MFTIKKHIWLTALLLGIVATATLITPAQAAKSKRPNILVIWGDDIGQANISYYTTTVPTDFAPYPSRS